MKFLTARWTDLLLLSWKIDPALVRPLVPRGTEIDFFQGETFVSLVAFRFQDTRVLGVPFPYYRSFEEANLRFYVKRSEGGEVRRAVVFIKEIVPRWLIAFIARAAYNEKYVSAPMSHRFEGSRFSYEWGKDSSVSASLEAPVRPMTPGSLDEFIAEHYWGYTTQRDGSTKEYRVEHPRWNVTTLKEISLEVNGARWYGEAFAAAITGQPASAFYAEGSEVAVYVGERIG